ncbi:MAG: GrpB family protein [Gemmatimonadales bacterium]
MSETTDDYLDSVTIGERAPHNAPVHLAPYDPAWPADYERLRAVIRDALGDRALELEHVGSTSVPGLTAKPVIDLVMTVADSTDEASYVPALERCGFTLRIREPEWHEHRLLKGPGRKANLHVFSVGCGELRRMVSFRDRLRSHPADRRFYEETKRALAARSWTHVQHYADAKSAVVEEILSRAAGAG